MFCSAERMGLISLLLVPLMLFGFALGRAEARPALKMDYHFGSGYRVDNLNWNIAGRSDGTSPNILSELLWNDITSLQFKGSVRAVLQEKIYFRAALHAGAILSGDVTDSDFNGDNRTMEFSRSDNAAQSGSVLGVSGGLGYRTFIPVFYGLFEFVPLVGFSFDQQNLTLTDGFQNIPLTGSFAGLNSTYRASWYSPWLGVDMSYTIADFIFRATAEYHYLYYRGQGNWNLRSDFAHPVSFRHTAEGSGLLISAAIEYALRNNLGLSLDFEYNNYETGPGNEKIFFADGFVTDTQLNVVNWDATSLMAALSWSF